jgi:hypothetical protein
MAITTSTRRNTAKPVEKLDKEVEIRDFYTEPIREEFAELAKPEKKKRKKNPNKTEFLLSLDNDLVERIQIAAKKRKLTRSAWITQACLAYLGDDI